MLEDVITTGAVLIVASAVFAGISRRMEAAARRLVLFGFVAHVGAVFVQIWVIEQVYGGGDIDGYYRSGVELANALRNDFDFIFPEMVRLFFHDPEANLPFAVFGGAGPTGSLSAITAILFYLLGDSLIGSSMAVALAAFFGKVAIAHAIGEDLDPEKRRLVLAASLLVPSVVFWSSTIAKEAVVVAFLGFALLALRPVIAGQVNPVKLVGAGLCLVPVAMIKPYVLLPLSIAFAAWLYWDRAGRLGRAVTIRPAYVVVAVVVVTGFFAVVGRLSPQFAVENLAKSTATSQIAGLGVEGGSNYQLRDPVAEDLSLQSQLLLAPIALPTALFRPFIFEVKNPMMLVNALETSVLLFLTIRLLLRGGLVRVRKAIVSNPTLVFCFVFTLVMGTAVGLASTNMGSLSRYRTPFMPFFVALVLILDGMFQPQRAVIRMPAPHLQKP
jgi:hypothetical protein